jgi:hypothetical protein
VPKEYGYCILVAVGSAFVVTWKAIQVISLGCRRSDHWDSALDMWYLKLFAEKPSDKLSRGLLVLAH